MPISSFSSLFCLPTHNFLRSININICLVESSPHWHTQNKFTITTKDSLEQPMRLLVLSPLFPDFVWIIYITNNSTRLLSIHEWIKTWTRVSNDPIISTWDPISHWHVSVRFSICLNLALENGGNLRDAKEIKNYKITRKAG